LFGQNTYRFSMNVDRETLLAVYEGTIRRIRVKTDEGLVLDIDAQHLKAFTTPDGIYGRFELKTSKENKFIGISKIG